MNSKKYILLLLSFIMVVSAFIMDIPSANAAIAIKDIVCTQTSAYALKEDGTVWAWGVNSNGQLGNGTINNSFIPVQVKGLSGIKAISCTQITAYALKEDGTVWAWGANSYGQLGNGTINNSFIPVQVKV